VGAVLTDSPVLTTLAAATLATITTAAADVRRDLGAALPEAPPARRCPSQLILALACPRRAA
jgi:hypothetical protein